MLWLFGLFLCLVRHGGRWGSDGFGVGCENERWEEESSRGEEGVDDREGLSCGVVWCDVVMVVVVVVSVVVVVMVV